MLLGLVAATLVAAGSYDRAGWPRDLAGEATYVMQAESLLRDNDLVYTRADFDRFLLARQGNPTDLELTSQSGRRITFDRPFVYALWLAPFLLLGPAGFALANALLLGLAAVCAARVLEQRLGPEAALWVAVAIFASVAWSYVFLATGDLFLLALAVFAACLVTDTVSLRRFALAGALLAVLLATRPLYGLLFLGALLAAPRGERQKAAGALALGAAAALLVIVGVQWWNGGGLHFAATSRFRFIPETGFPLVDFAAGEWTATVRRLAALHWDGAPRLAWGFDLRLWQWNALYLLAGQSIGLLPYFAPLLLLILLARGEAWGWWLAAGLGLVALLVFHPFNLYGGEGAIANRLFLPFYGALWCVGERRRSLFWGILVVLLAAPFLSRLWTAPRAYPFDPAGGYRHVTEVARRFLPYETSQRWLPGGQMVELGDLRVRLLDAGAWAETRRGRLRFEGEATELLVASPRPVEVLRLDFGAAAPAELTVQGADLAERLLAPGGGISFRLRPHSPVPSHPLWFTPERQWLYRLAIAFARAPTGPLDVTVVVEREVEKETS